MTVELNWQLSLDTVTGLSNQSQKYLPILLGRDYEPDCDDDASGDDYETANYTAHNCADRSICAGCGWGAARCTATRHTTSRGTCCRGGSCADGNIVGHQGGKGALSEGTAGIGPVSVTWVRDAVTAKEAVSDVGPGEGYAVGILRITTIANQKTLLWNKSDTQDGHLPSPHILASQTIPRARR